MSLDAHLQRAELLADLGRYDEAADELSRAIASDPRNVDALALLARVRLATGQPKEALEAANQAMAADPNDLRTLAIRGLVLAELNHTANAAEMADELLRLGGPDNAFAQISAAAILSDVRNGQRALDAAWRAVQLAPEQPSAHLVLGQVAARLEQFELAERAYREALRLDPELANSARHDMGLIRLEQSRFAEGLEHLVEAAASDPSNMDLSRSVRLGLHEVLWYGAGYAIIAPIIAAIGGDDGGIGWRLRASLLAAIGIVAAAIFASRLPGRVSAVLPAVLKTDPLLRIAVSGVAAAPILLLVYAAVGTPWPLVLAILGGFVALLARLRTQQR